MQRFQERSLRVKLPRSERLTGDMPFGKQDLKGHNGFVTRVVALPKNSIVATACCSTDEDIASALRI